MIVTECAQLAHAATMLADAAEAFVGEQWRFYGDLFDALRKAVGREVVSRVFDRGDRAQEMTERKTMLGAVSWYLYQRSGELRDRGRELKAILETVKDVFPKADARKKAVA